MNEESKIIEVEVEGMTYDEKKEEQKKQPAKVVDDHRKSIYFFGKASSVLLGLASPGFGLSLVSSLVFSILYSEATDNVVRFTIMILSWCLVGFFVLLFALGMVFRHIMRKLKKKKEKKRKKNLK